MFYYIVKVTIYSAPLVLVILESEFDVIFKWIYVYMETVVWLIVVKNVESPLCRRKFMPWKTIYRSAKPQVLFIIKMNVLSNCTDWQKL